MNQIFVDYTQNCHVLLTELLSSAQFWSARKKLKGIAQPEKSIPAFL